MLVSKASEALPARMTARPHLLFTVHGLTKAQATGFSAREQVAVIVSTGHTRHWEQATRTG